MFSPLNINPVLESHSIFQTLGKREAEETVNKSCNSRAHQLIHIFAGNLFVWEEQRSCLLTTNLREVLNHSSEPEKIQTLLCRNAPLFEIRSIIFNDSSTHVALVGSRGVTVLVLPKRWGRDAEYEGGKSSIICRSFPVAERFFTCNISVQLLQASWYPGGATNPHLCLLTSDNVLKIYNIQSDSHIPIQIHKLNQLLEENLSMGGSRMSLLSLYSVSSGLGETAISFDFAPTVDFTPSRSILQRTKPEATKLQPVYLLQGNGDVLLLITSLTDNKFSKGILHGPLIMLPSAEDNYGTDSCAIHVMKTSPSIIVIATSMGKLHHCISLWSQNEGIDPTEELDTQSIISRSVSQMGVSLISSKGDLVPPTLYVYETVELELDLTEAEEQESHFVTLHEDPVLSSRYHSCTSVGVHSVALPWLSKITAFVQSDDEDKEILTELALDDHCVVEHVLCTKPTPSSLPCPIKGMTIASDPMLGPALLCLTNDNKCNALPLLNTFRSGSPPLMSYIEDETIVTSPLKKLHESSFEDHVRSLLKREVSQPMIRSGEGSNEKECLQLVTKATQVLRDEYILKQKLARNAITKRVQLLQEQKQQQLSDLRDLSHMKENITDEAEQIAVSYEDCQERQQSLLERLDVVVKRVKSSDPVLSQAEVKMGKELKALADKLRKIDNSIKQLKVKQEYQSKKLENHEAGNGFSTKSGGSTGKSLQIDQYKQILLEEGQKISELIKKLNNLNLQVGL